MKKNNIVFLSTHLDDAILSCGGQIRQFVQSGTIPVIVTVFAGLFGKSLKLSPLAQSFHEKWGNPSDIIQTRRNEDADAVRVLGAKYNHLDFLDCIYRQDDTGDYVVHEADDIFGNVPVSQKGLIEKIADKIYQLYGSDPDTVLYGPLSIGGHIDHQIVHAVTILLDKKGMNVKLYEDYPYGEWDDAYEEAWARLADREKWKEKIIPLSSDDIKTRIESVERYASQIVMLFDTEPECESRQKAFISKTKGERIWVR